MRKKSSEGQKDPRAETSPRRLGKLHFETLAAFRYALRRFIHFSDEAASAAGVTPQQYQALLAIKGFPGRDDVTVGDLAERLQLRHHSAVGLVDRLAAEELVVRTHAREDRRRVIVHLTERGEKILQRLASVHREQLRRIGPEISQLLGRLEHGEE
jgi:DNA-binding MarR family transcriptional regulator